MKKKLLSLLLAVATSTMLLTAVPVLAVEDSTSQVMDASDDTSAVQESDDIILEEDAEVQQESEIIDDALDSPLPSVETSEDESVGDAAAVDEEIDADDTSDVVVVADAADEEALEADEDVPAEESVGTINSYKDYDKNDYAAGPTTEAKRAGENKVGTLRLPYEGAERIEVYAERSGYRSFTKSDAAKYDAYRIPYLFYGEDVAIFSIDKTGTATSAYQFTFSKNDETNYGLYVKGRELSLLYQKTYDTLFLESKLSPAIHYKIDKNTSEVEMLYGDYHVKAVTGNVNNPSYTYEFDTSFKKGDDCDQEYCLSYMIDAVNSMQIKLCYTPYKPFTRVIFSNRETHTSYDGRDIFKNLYTDAKNHTVTVYEGDDESHAVKVMDGTFQSTIDDMDIRFTQFVPGASGKVYEPKNIIMHKQGGSVTLQKGKDYTVRDTVDSKTNKAVRIFTGIGSFHGERVFEKDPIKLTNANITTKSKYYPYNGKGRKPTPIVTYNGKRLVLGQDFTVTYKNNKNIGTGTIIAKGIGQYTGTAKCTFYIRYDLSEGTATTKHASYEYTGGARKPAVTVKYGTKVLTNGTDYSLTYKNNTNVGTATITVTGKGNYMGSKNITFKLTPKPLTGSDITARTVHMSYAYDGKAKTPKPVVKDGDKKLVLGTDYTLSYKDNVSIGTGYVIITGKGNYKGTKKVSFPIELAFRYDI